MAILPSKCEAMERKETMVYTSNDALLKDMMLLLFDRFLREH